MGHLDYTYKMSVSCKLNPLSLNSRSKSNFSFQFIASCVVQYGELAGYHLFGSKLVKLSILPILFVQFVLGSLGELRSRHLCALFQITNQLKILTAAVFSVTLLHKQLKRLQWISLLLLFIGVCLVQIETQHTVTMKTTEPSSRAHEQSLSVGLASILSACIVSGFAGVYLEKILKVGNTPFWIRNVQMYILGSFLGILGIAFTDGSVILDKGFFYGYDSIVWLVVCFASAGGILVSFILKYAGTITKGFATSCAIVFSSLVSVYLFGFLPSKMFVTGGSFVIFAVLLYGF